MGRRSNRARQGIVTHSKHAEHVSITLKHSSIGRPYKQKLYLQNLGLRKLHQTVTRPRTPQVLGLIEKVKHLVRVRFQ